METQLQFDGTTQFITSNWTYDNLDRLTNESVTTATLPTTLTLSSRRDINSGFSTTLSPFP
jgi:hypothetical protein